MELSQQARIKRMQELEERYNINQVRLFALAHERMQLLEEKSLYLLVQFQAKVLDLVIYLDVLKAEVLRKYRRFCVINTLMTNLTSQDQEYLALVAENKPNEDSDNI